MTAEYRVSVHAHAIILAVVPILASVITVNTWSSLVTCTLFLGFITAVTASKASSLVYGLSRIAGNFTHLIIVALLNTWVVCTSSRISPIIILLFITSTLIPSIRKESYRCAAFVIALLLAVVHVNKHFMHDFSFAFMNFILPTFIFCAFFYNLGNQLQLLCNELHQKNRELQEATQMHNNVLSLLSHELKTPINQVLASCDLLENTRLNKEQLALTKLIKEGGSTLLEHYNAILDLLQVKSAMKLARVQHSLEECVDDAINQVSPKINAKNIKLVVEYSDDLPLYVMGDSRRLRQLLFHLLDNAVKFSPEHDGIVTLKVYPESTDSDNVVFQVNDNGIGMSEDDLQKIYVPFWQADMSLSRQNGGVGLGLPLIEQIIRLFGGKISFTSKVGKGTCVKITIPLPPANSKNSSTGTCSIGVLTCGQNEGQSLCIPVDPISAANSEIFGGNRSMEEDTAHIPTDDQAILTMQKIKGPINISDLKVLVVEDNPLNMKLMKRMIAAAGVGPDEATDGQKAIRAASLKDYHLIFMDIHMPVCDGIVATREIRKLLNEAGRLQPYIVAVTADDQAGTPDKCLDAGVDEVLHKPIRQDKINHFIKKFTSPQ